MDNTSTAPTEYHATQTDSERPISYILPQFLQKRADGAIVVRGHRITLFAILEWLNSRRRDPPVSVAEICDAYPTLPVETVWEILHYINRHESSLAQYVSEQRTIAAEMQTTHPYRGPSLAELRRRAVAG